MKYIVNKKIINKIINFSSIEKLSIIKHIDKY